MGFVPSNAIIQQSTCKQIPACNSFFYLVLFGLILFYLFLLFYKEDFANLDNTQLTHYSLIGRPFGMPIWKDGGRFWPLGFQEYNFLALFGNSIAVFKAYSAFQLLVTLFCCHSLFTKSHAAWGILVLTMILATPSITISFFGFIFGERNVLFWMAILILALQHYPANNKVLSLSVAIISAQFALYYKEPFFVIISVYSLIRIVFVLSNQRRHSKPLKFSRIVSLCWPEICLLILSLAFISYYSIEVYPYIVTSYASDRDLQIIDLFVGYLKFSSLFALALPLALLKLMLIWAKKVKFDAFWDSLFIAAIFYVVAFVELEILSTYYTAPADLIFILYTVEFARKGVSIKGMAKPLVLLPLSVGISMVIFTNIAKSSYEVLQRKLFIDSNVSIARFLSEYPVPLDTRELSLFFSNAADPFQIMEFVGFLEYKGFNTRPKLYAAHSDKTTVVAKADHPFEDDLCTHYRPFQCFHADGPQSGDLTIILPGRSYGDIKPTDLYGGHLLYAYAPSFSIPEKILLALSRSDQASFNRLRAYVIKNPMASPEGAFRPDQT